MKALVIIPTYNESGNIENIINAVFSLGLPLHVLVIDDSSTDGTDELVKGLQNKYLKKVHMVQRPSKMGLATAYQRGFDWALEHPDYDYIFEMECRFFP